jgi:hypothetical protein
VPGAGSLPKNRFVHDAVPVTDRSTNCVAVPYRTTVAEVVAKDAHSSAIFVHSEVLVDAVGSVVVLDVVPVVPVELLVPEVDPGVPLTVVVTVLPLTWQVFNTPGTGSLPKKLTEQVPVLVTLL